MLSSIGAALTPKADFSLGDIIDEVRTLRDENAALKAQLAVHSRAAVTSEDAARASSRVAESARETLRARCAGSAASQRER